MATAALPVALVACSLPIVIASARSSDHVGGSPLGLGGSRTVLDVPSSRSTATIAHWADYVLTIAAVLLTHSSTLSQRLASLPGKHLGT